MSTEADDLVKLARECGATDERITDQLGLLIRTEVLFERLDQLANFASHIAAQKAAEVDAPSDVTKAMVDAYLKAQREAVEYADRNYGRPNIGGLHTDTVRGACRAGLRAAFAAASPAEPGGKV